MNTNHIPFEQLPITNRFMFENSPFNKGVRYDVFVKEQSPKGEILRIFDIEMQIEDTHELPKRARYYQALCDSEALNKGESYRNLKEQYIIFICPNDIFKQEQAVYRFKNLEIGNAKIELGDQCWKNFYIFSKYKDVAEKSIKEYLEYVRNKGIKVGLIRPITLNPFPVESFEKLDYSKVKAIKGDVLLCHGDFPDSSLDLIVSNPPYIKNGDLSALQPEVQFEPKTALDGGESGYDFYEAIILSWSRKLKSGGALVFELGENQAERVTELMKKRGFENIRTELDFGGCERAIIGIRQITGL